MNFSKLDRLITIERATETVDQNGRVALSWVTLVQTYAQVKIGTGQERAQRGQLQSQQNTIFTIRYYSTSAITTAERISYGGKHYNIISVAEIGRKAGLELVAVQAGGR